MKLHTTLIAGLTLLTTAGSPLAAQAALRAKQAYTADEVADAKAQLHRQLLILEKIEPFVEQHDLGRLFILRQASQRVLSSIAASGLAHMKTLREYQTLIVTYRYSNAYFKKIGSQFNQGRIAELLRLVDRIIEDRGFDDSPYTQIIASVFTQIRTLLLELSKLSVPDSLKAKIQALMPDFGNVLALAKQGDRPRAFEAATALYRKLRTLNPELNDASVSKVALESVLQVQGLNDFYAEYAQVEQERESIR